MARRVSRPSAINIPMPCPSSPTDADIIGGEGPCKVRLMERRGSESSNYSNYSSPTSCSTEADVAGLESPRPCGALGSGTLLFLDWDNTVFPTTEIFDRWGLCTHSMISSPKHMSGEQTCALRAWEDALYEYLLVCISISAECTIVTNSQRPWVSTSIARFAPKVKPLLGKDGPVKVIYAREVLEQRRGRTGRSVLPVRSADTKNKISSSETDNKEAKYVAMNQAIKKFRAKHLGQSIRNIMSIGDDWYEHDAAQKVASQCSEDAPVHVKTFMTPGTPTISELTLRLRFGRLLLPLFTQHDGDIDVNVGTGDNPLELLGEALQIPELRTLPIPLHAWGIAPLPGDESHVAEALVETEALLRTWASTAC